MRGLDRAGVGALLAAVLHAGCSCTPVVDGVVARDVLPVADATVKTYLFTVPADGELDLTLSRLDARSDYAGPVYLFVTTPDCASVTDDPPSLRNASAFQPRCSVLANSFAEGNCCLGRTRLADPAHVKAGTTVKLFVYGLSQPHDLPYELRFASGDAGCAAP